MKSLTLYFLAFTLKFSISWCFDVKEDKHVYSNVVNEGHTKLVYLGDKFRQKIDISGDVSHIIENATKKYTTEIDKLFMTMYKHEVKYEIEMQYYYLYIVESSNEIFVDNAVTLLNNIAINANNYELDIDSIMDTKNIKKVVFDEKKNNLMYICLYLEVCRSFPAFSDHLVDLLGEILILPTYEFTNITSVLTDVVGEKSKFLTKITDDDITVQVSKQLESLVGHPEGIRKFLTIFKDVVYKRNKLFKTKDAAIKTKTKVLKLLIDIVDKAFEAVGEEAISIEFDNIIKSLNQWATGEPIDMKSMLINASDYFFEILDFYWDQETKNEVKLLIEVYLTGTTALENSILYEDLLYTGSKFLKNENFLSVVDLTI